ncbi:MAG: CAP domain-containing protein [Pseudomonadota bacterium]
MRLLFSLFIAATVLLTACAPAPPNRLGADGKPLPQLYRIRDRDAANIQFRMLDSVNALRGASGQQPVSLNSELTAAAATHAQDMSVQNRPWHFGSDGSSPIDRVQRVGFQGSLVGENISETYETELETLGAWMEQPDTRRIILSSDADSMGFSWFQEKNGKIWWTMVMGNSRDFGAFNGGFAS